MWSAWNSMVVDVKQLEEELLHHWRTNLEPHGAPKPTPVQMNQLICLYANFQKPVKITEIKPWLQEHGLKGSNQARHLGRYGWMVASGFTRYKNGPVLGRLAKNEYMLLSVTEPNLNGLRIYQLDKIKKKIPSEKKLEKLYAEITVLHEVHLKPVGVRLPTKRSTVDRLCLLALYFNLGKPVKQDELELWFKKFNKKYKYQARSLAQRGFYIETGNSRGVYVQPNSDMDNRELKLVSMTEPNPEFAIRQNVRKGNISKLAWEDKLVAFNKRGCAVCGEKSKHYDKGHLNNTKSASDENIVPMCPSCNIWAGKYDLSFKMVDGTLIARPDLSSWVKKSEAIDDL